jgi:hypothetical protein
VCFALLELNNSKGFEKKYNGLRVLDIVLDINSVERGNLPISIRVMALYSRKIVIKLKVCHSVPVDIKELREMRNMGIKSRSGFLLGTMKNSMTNCRIIKIGTLIAAFCGKTR